MGILFWLSSLSYLPGPQALFSFQDKFEHVAAYALLGWLYAMALTGRARAPRRRVLLAAGLALLYGASDEFHQSLVPGRDANPADLAADGIGGLAGAFLARWTGKRHVRNAA